MAPVFTSISMMAPHPLNLVDVCSNQQESYKLSEIDVDHVADVDAEMHHRRDGLVLPQEAPSL